MSEDLIAFIDKLDIQAFVLTDGSTVLGKIVGSNEFSIDVIGLCRIEPIEIDDVLQQMIMPAVPGSITETATLAKVHIIIQSKASIILKKAYCDTLLRLKLALSSDQFIDPSIDSNSFKPKGNSNPFKDRWN